MFFSQKQSDLVEFWADFWFVDTLFGQKSIFCLEGVKFFITNLDHILGLNYPENLSSIRLGWVLGWFWDFWHSFWPKIDFWLRGRTNCSSLTLIICWSWTILKIWAQSDLVEFWADFGFFDTLFGQKLIFCLGGPFLAKNRFLA